MHCMSVADPVRSPHVPDRERVPGAVPHVAPTHTRRTAAGLGTNEPQTGNGTRGPAPPPAAVAGPHEACILRTARCDPGPRYIMRVFFTLEDLIRYRQSRRSELRARH